MKKAFFPFKTHDYQVAKLTLHFDNHKLMPFFYSIRFLFTIVFCTFVLYNETKKAKQR